MARQATQQGKVTFTKAGEKIWECTICQHIVFCHSWKSLDINGLVKGTALRPDKLFAEAIDMHQCNT